jgi:RNA polymerase sigma-70 factor (ECF subfamily)
LKVPPEEADERALVEAAQGDPAHFAPLYEAYFDRVYAYVVRRVRDRADAEDLTSEVFRRALRGLPRFEWRGAPFGAWLMRIAANAVADRWQRAQRQRDLERGERTKEPASEDLERRVLLFSLVRRLPEDQGRVIQMRFVEQKTIREIAAELGRSEGAVKQLQLRALERLRARMDESHA